MQNITEEIFPSADMHLHTCFSHGVNTPAEMYEAATQKNLRLIGFSEHSPRPLGFDYTHEYREKLQCSLPDYIKLVTELKKHAASQPEKYCQVLLGMEIDWLDGEIDFIKSACSLYDFDFLLGSTHFLGHVGFDDNRKTWQDLSQEECEINYQKYFHSWREMINSHLFDIAAHPDLIKIFSVNQFHIWINKSESRQLIYQCLQDLRDAGMCMEVSSAGLRKPCKEIYPCPELMNIAAELNIPISIASDAHCVADVAYAFPELARYVKSFGFTEQIVVDHHKKIAFSL